MRYAKEQKSSNRRLMRDILFMGMYPQQLAWKCFLTHESLNTKMAYDHQIEKWRERGISPNALVPFRNLTSNSSEALTPEEGLGNTEPRPSKGWQDG